MNRREKRFTGKPPPGLRMYEKKIFNFLTWPIFRSPSWPVWAPRLPSVTQSNGTENQDATSASATTPTTTKKSISTATKTVNKSSAINGNHQMLTPPDRLSLSPPSSLSLVKTSRNRLLSGSLTSRLLKPSYVTTSEPTSPIKHNHNGSIADESVVFRVPNGKPRWRGAGNVSKTCDCIEGKTSPVMMRLAEQVRSVSSPIPLHAVPECRVSVSGNYVGTTFTAR